MDKKKGLIIAGLVAGVTLFFIIATTFVSGYLDGNNRKNSLVSNELAHNLDNDSEVNNEEEKLKKEEEKINSETSSSETVLEDTTESETIVPESKESDCTTQNQIISNIVEMKKTMFGKSTGNVRTGASTGYPSIGRIAYGQSIDITGKDGEWYRINFNGQAAYVHESLLSDTMPQQSQLNNGEISNTINNFDKNQNAGTNVNINQSTDGNTNINNNQNTNTNTNVNQNTNTNNNQNTNTNINQGTNGNTDANQNTNTNINQGTNSNTNTNTNTNQGSVTFESYVDEVIRLVNIERNNVGLPSLSKNETLCQAAQTRANEIISVFSHTRPDGTSCFTVADEYKISWMNIGENIAKGQRNPKEVVAGWMNSPGHRANILNEKFNQIGVGVVKSGGTYYWTQMFIRASK